MGRGRAKAKQTKVARELKYSSPGMDLNRLTKDLQADQHHSTSSAYDDDVEPDYSKWLDEDDGDDAESEDSAAS